MAVFVQAKKIKIKQCDIQYWSNDAENSARNKLHFKIYSENSYFKL